MVIPKWARVLLLGTLLDDVALEIATALVMTAVAVEFNRIACTLALCAAVFAVRLWWAGAARILTLFLVSHRVSS